MSAAYKIANQDDLEVWNKVTEGGKVKEKKIMEVIRREARNCCSAETLKTRLPFLTWIPTYSTDDLIGDFIAGLTVGLTVIPQGIAYALIAGLPPNYGLYSAFMGSFLYVLFGSCKDITIGPTAIMSILTYEYAHGNAEFANLLCFTSGIIILILGFFNLGFLINFVSKPVISGFTSAAAITIFTSQVKGLLGIKIKTHGFIDTWVQVFKHISETRWQDLILGLICFIVLLLMRKLKDLKRFKKNEDDLSYQRAYKFIVFIISVSRNAIIVIITTVISACLNSNQPFTITGAIEPGLPDMRVPSFTITEGNTTKSFGELMAQAGGGVFILPLIAVLENIAIGSAFSQGKTIDATQEMIALGICNLGNSFCQAFVTTGSFSRTAVNSNSGVRTPAGGIVTGVVVVLALAVLTPYFTYIPLASLAAVIMCAVIFMVEYHDIVPIWKVRRTDEFVLWVSFLSCIFWKLEYGIVLGAFVNLLILLIVEANPKIKTIPVLEEENGVPAHIIIVPKCGLLYINIEKIRTYVSKTGINMGQSTVPIILDCSHFSTIDYSAARGVEAMLKDFKKREQLLFFLNASPQLQKALRALCPNIIFVEEENIADTILGRNPNGASNSEEQVEFPPEESERKPMLVASSGGLQSSGREDQACLNQEEKSLIKNGNHNHNNHNNESMA
ncbi:UNVERIFIED_CONTAM: hypothetical protein RMT77_013910 [Armadillidium vulgare]